MDGAQVGVFEMSNQIGFGGLLEGGGGEASTPRVAVAVTTGLAGMAVGLLCLLPLYAVGGMGAGDVKLMAGIGAWLGWKVTLYAFCVSTIVGAAMALVMVWKRGSFQKHYLNFLIILTEWLQVRNPSELSKIAAERKSSMLLLPYGIPICVGSIGYFAYAGLL